MTIQTKLILIFMATFILATLLISYNAFHLFNDHSRNEIFTHTTALSKAKAAEINQIVSTYERQLKSLAPSFPTKTIPASLIKNLRKQLGILPFKYVAFYKREKSSWTKALILKPAGSNNPKKASARYETIVDNLIAAAFPWNEIAQGRKQILPVRSEQSEFNHHLFMAIPWTQNQSRKGRPNNIMSLGFIIGLIDETAINNALEQSYQYTMLFINNQGDLLSASNNLAWSTHEKKIKSHILFQEINKTPVTALFKTFLDQSTHKNWFGAINKVWNANLSVIVQIPEDTALAVSRTLVYRSFLISLIIFGLTVMIIYFFSRHLTTPISRLSEAVTKFGQGNFAVTILPTANDEIGKLATTFKQMATEIQLLLKSTADKARMEAELKTARFVQNTLFPPAEITLDRLTMSSYYQPATECGGDFWGYFRTVENKYVILIGDATGHGVPAALLTAGVKSACLTIKYIFSQSLETLKPSTILSLLNEGVCEATKGTYNMTFFVGILDIDSGEFTYSNASHNEPFLYQALGNPTAPITKSQLTFLPEAKGKRLGEVVGYQYQDKTITILPSDTLILYTDGITESENTAGKIYSTGKFIRSLLKYMHLPTHFLKTSCLQELSDFSQGAEQIDDITLLILRYND